MFNGLVFKMALTSLRQRKSRSLLVILMISISLWGLLFMEGIYDGMTEQMIDNGIRSTSGDVMLFGRGYRRQHEIKFNIVNPDEVVEAIRRDTRVVTYSLRIVQDGLLATARASRPAVIIGMQPKLEKIHARLDEYMEQGHLDFGSKHNRAVVGVRLAEKLNLKMGSKFVLSAQDTGNEVVSILLRVAGFIRTHSLIFDTSAVLIDFGVANDLLQMQGAVTQISLLLHNQDDAPMVQRSFAGQFANLELFRWDEISPVLLQSRQLMTLFNRITSGLVFCVAGLGIFGVVLVSVLERMREFGIMLAIGTRFQQIALLIFYESTLLGLTGFGVGAIFGGGTLLYFKLNGLDLSIMSEGLNAFGVDSLVYAMIRLEYFTMAFGAVLASICLSTLIPLRILQKSKPIQAINEI